MIIIEQIDANIIAPKILGNSAGISSLGVIIAVTIMGAYFGIIGMIIGVPIFAIIIAIFKDLIEKKLAKKQLPVDTKEYYTDKNYSSESEEYNSFTRLLFEPVLKKVSKNVNNTLNRNFKKEDEIGETDDDEENISSDDQNSNN